MEVVKEKVQFQKYPNYKDSGVEWLGEIPEHWEIKRLGSLLNPISTKNKPELPLLSITREKGVIKRNIEDEDENHNYIPDDLSGYKVLKKGQFGMNKMKAWQGSYGISKFTGIVSPAYYVFDFFYEVDPEFFNVAIRSKKYISFFGSASDGVGIGQWDVSKSRMKSIPFLLPPIQEQTAIASFLDEKCDKIDAAIVQKQKLIELLKERKQIIIQNAVTKGLDPNVKMKESGVEWIGEIPEHWKVERSKWLFYQRKERARKTDEPLTSSQKLGVIPQAEYMEMEGRRVTQIEFNKEIQKHVEKGDFMISMRSFQGGLEYSEYEGCISSAYVPLIPRDNIHAEYYKYVFKSDRYIKALQSTSNLVRDGQALRYDNFTQVPLLIVPFEEQEAIAKYIDGQLEKTGNTIDLQQQQIEKLKEYKSSLIDAAVTGKIKVS